MKTPKKSKVLTREQLRNMKAIPGRMTWGEYKRTPKGIAESLEWLVKLDLLLDPHEKLTRDTESIRAFRRHYLELIEQVKAEDWWAAIMEAFAAGRAAEAAGLRLDAMKGRKTTQNLDKGPQGRKKQASTKKSTRLADISQRYWRIRKSRPTADSRLKERLRPELPGIIRWLVAIVDPDAS